MNLSASQAKCLAGARPLERRGRPHSRCCLLVTLPDDVCSCNSSLRECTLTPALAAEPFDTGEARLSLSDGFLKGRKVRDQVAEHAWGSGCFVRDEDTRHRLVLGNARFVLVVSSTPGFGTCKQPKCDGLGSVVEPSAFTQDGPRFDVGHEA